MTEHTKIPLLAEELVNKYQLLKMTSPQVVTQLLHDLRDVVLYGDPVKRRAHAAKRAAAAAAAGSNAVGLEHLPRYIKQLRKDLPDKLQAAKCILELAKAPDNLSPLLDANDGALLGVLARVIKEDSKLSIELTITLMYIAFCFSMYSQFHQDLAKHRIGDSCFRCVETEIQRKRVFEEDLRGRKQQYEEMGMSAEAKAELKQKLARMQKNYVAMCRDQDVLLAVCFHVLLNLAEDAKVEEKMLKRHISEYLITALATQHVDLLMVVLTFLKKLSIYRENVVVMAGNGVLEALRPVLETPHDPVVVTALRFLYNLSFDPRLQEQMVKHGYIAKLVAFMPNVSYQTTVLKVLYHLSRDDRFKPDFCYTDCIAILRQLMVDSVEQISADVAALTLSLVSNSQNADSFCSCSSHLSQLALRFKHTQDVLLLRVLHAIALSESSQVALLPHVETLVEVMTKHTENKPLMKEIFATVSCINTEKVSWPALANKFKLFEFIAAFFNEDFQGSDDEEEFILELVVLLGCILGAPGKNTVPAAMTANLHNLLYPLLTEYSRSTDVLLAVLDCYRRMFFCHEALNGLLKLELAKPLLEYLSTKNQSVYSAVVDLLDIIMENDEHWAETIRARKFHAYNAQWIDAVTNRPGEEYYESDDASATFDALFSAAANANPTIGQSTNGAPATAAVCPAFSALEQQRSMRRKQKEQVRMQEELDKQRDRQEQQDQPKAKTILAKSAASRLKDEECCHTGVTPSPSPSPGVPAGAAEPTVICVEPAGRSSARRPSLAQSAGGATQSLSPPRRHRHHAAGAAADGAKGHKSRLRSSSPAAYTPSPALTPDTTDVVDYDATDS
eukprot:TRINITY_DN419_c0_g2_i1.p1 TRINITY_DN419_c0_g2~~TRINITY_DN419_c0_g2_i1.p1  ORF type:complete len:970 (-),score=282.86 TRINITY_DN419_c0_g2_i1:45-2579(-)